jgi:alanyl-tRNA synthetase
MVGLDALRALTQERDMIRRLAAEFKAQPTDLEQRISDSLEELRLANKRISELENAQAMSQLPNLLEQAQEIAGHKVLGAVLQGVSADQLRSLAMRAREELGSAAVIVLGSSNDDSATVMCAVGPEAIASGVKAGDLAKIASAALGGGGGGKPDLAQGGGPNVQKLSEAIAAALSAIK